MSEELSAARLRELLSYDPETGVFTWRVSRKSGTAVAGAVAGTISDRGYVCIKIFGRKYRAHRLAWLHVHGLWPEYDVDHRNRVRHDNRIANLRAVTKAVNQQNRSDAHRNNKVGVLGVQRRRARYVARIQVGGDKKYLGSFKTIEAAQGAYLAAKQVVHPDA